MDLSMQALVECCYGYMDYAFLPKTQYQDTGPENLESKYAAVGINQDRPHNLLIQLATTSGIPGLMLYTFAVGLIIYRSFKNLNIKDNIHIISLFSVIAYLISSMFGNSMYYTSPYYFILLGLLLNELILKSEKETNSSHQFPFLTLLQFVFL